MTYIELDVVYTHVNEDEKLYESLGINSAQEKAYVDKAIINLSRVESFYPSANDAGERVTTTIVLNSGESWTTTMRYEEFKTKFFNLLEQHENRTKNPGS